MEPNDDLVAETAARVGDYWRENRLPLLLSALGSAEGGRVSREARRKSGSLRRFLESEAGDRVTVVQHSDKPTVVGVVPKNDETGAIENWDFLLDETGGKRQLPRLHPALWAAFRKPLKESFDRYLLTDGPVRFVDVAHGTEVQNGLKVDPTKVLGPDALSDAIHENATTWLRDHQLEISDYRPEDASDDAGRLPRDDVLGRLILALDARDLERMSVPMDVVAKLRRRSAR